MDGYQYGANLSVKGGLAQVLLRVRRPHLESMSGGCSARRLDAACSLDTGSPDGVRSAHTLVVQPASAQAQDAEKQH